MDVTVLEEDADGKAFSDLLKATMAGGDRRLRALGFDITSILHVAGGAPSASPSLAGIANDLLRETYANIARHAQSGSKADLSVILKPNAVEITQINQARSHPETDRTQSGRPRPRVFQQTARIAWRQTRGNAARRRMDAVRLSADSGARNPATPCRTPRIVTGSDGREKRKGTTKGATQMWYTLTCRGVHRHPIFPIEKGYASPCDPTDTWQSVESQGDAFFFSSVVSERQFRRNTVRPARRRGSRAAAATGCAPPSRRWSCA